MATMDSKRVVQVNDLTVRFKTPTASWKRCATCRSMWTGARRWPSSASRAGQVGDVAGADAAGGVRRRAHRQRRHAAAPAQRRGAGPGGGVRRDAADARAAPTWHDLPGADDLVEPQLHGRQPDRRGAAAAPGPGRGGGARRDAAHAGTRAHPRGPCHPGPLSAPAVRRHAPARHDRHGAVLQAAAADRRRAHHRAGRDHPGPDPATDPAAAGGNGHGRDLHHARHGRGGRGGRPRAGHVSRRQG